MQKERKKCPRCGNINLIIFRTLNYKQCVKKGCWARIAFNLKPGQAPLIGPARKVK